MTHPVVKVIVVAAVVVGSTAVQPPTAAQSQGSCVSLTRFEQGHFAAGGWVTDVVNVSLNGIERSFTTSPVTIDGAGAPVDRGWSTHGVEAYENVLLSDPGGSFVEIIPFVATVDMDLTALTGDRRKSKIPDWEPYTLYFNYHGEGTISDGTGLFANATGHTVTRGPFSLDFVNIGGAPVPAAVFGLGTGFFTFETHGQICGADVEGLDVR